MAEDALQVRWMGGCVAVLLGLWPQGQDDNLKMQALVAADMTDLNLH